MKKNIFPKLLLLGTTTLIFILLAELLLPRFLAIDYNESTYNTAYHHTFLPNHYRIKKTGQDTIYLQTDSQGFRSKEYSYAKNGTLRILTLGDSIIANVAVPDEKMYTTILEKSLTNTTKKTWEVINRGIESWSPDFEYLYLTKEGYKYQPDIILLEITLGNDYAGVHTNNITKIKNGKAEIIKEHFELPTAFNRLRWWLNQHSALYNLLADTYKARKNPEGEYQSYISEGYTEEFEQALTLMKALLLSTKDFAHNHKSELIVIIFPDPRQNNKDYYNHWNTKNKNYIPFEDLRYSVDVLQEFLKENNIFFIDASQTVNNVQDYVSLEDGHMSIQGSKKLAEQTTQKIQEIHAQAIITKPNGDTVLA